MKDRIVWIDNAKGIGIILVIFAHTNFTNSSLILWLKPSLWIFVFSSAFLLTQHNLDLKTYYSKEKSLKLIRKILIPFVFFETIIWLLYGIKGFWIPCGNFIKYGIGPGSYYPIVFIQEWLLIPFVAALSKCKKSFIFFVIVCSIAEFTIVMISKDWLYRYSVIRFLMLIYLGCNYEEIIKYKKLVLLGVIISIAMAIIEINVYKFDSISWDGQHWFNAFYILFWIPIFKMFNLSVLRYVARYSYDLFLVQMLFFAVCSPHIFHLNDMSYVTNRIIWLFICYLMIGILTFLYVNFKRFLRHVNLKYVMKSLYRSRVSKC